MLIQKKAVSVILLILGLSFSGPSYANAENSSDDEGNPIVDILRITSLMKFDDKGNLDDKGSPLLPSFNIYLGSAEMLVGVKIFAVADSVVVDFIFKKKKLFRFLGVALIAQGIFTIGDSFYMVGKEKKNNLNHFLF